MGRRKKPNFRPSSNRVEKRALKGLGGPSKGKQSAQKKKKKPVGNLQVQQQQPLIPFNPEHRILLLGEGDFSFSRSLLESHGCVHICATSYDSHSAVASKYPTAAANINALAAEEGCRVEHGVDATKLGKAGVAGAAGGKTGGGSKAVRNGGWDRIAFNFPHVGGLTKDVNRQVRANQAHHSFWLKPYLHGVEMLVNFFRCAVPLLALNGKVIVTIFEGEPYELWNVRNLARHVGLHVERSFRFEASAYPRYKHARTLGHIERGGAWRGEDRLARTFIFAAFPEEMSEPKKRKRAGSSSDEG